MPGKQGTADHHDHSRNDRRYKTGHDHGGWFTVRRCRSVFKGKPGGSSTDNIHLPHYSSYYGSTTKSYLAQTADGGYQRAEYINDKIVVDDLRQQTESGFF